MWVLRARLSFVNLDRERNSALHCSGSCPLKQKLCCVMPAILSASRRKIRLQDETSPSDVVRFVSILWKARGVRASLPVTFPSPGEWLVRVMASQGQFVFGMYRRHMKTISYLGQIDKLYGVPATTRNWNTIISILRILKGQESKGR